jgi:DNA-binding MarR family transcriptional regulator
MLTNHQPNESIGAIVESWESLMAAVTAAHAPGILDVDLTMAQAKVVHLVAGGEIGMSQLAARLGVSLSTTSSLVDRLVDHGHLVRREDPVDRRHTLVSLTAHGHAAVDHFRSIGREQLRRLLATLDPDRLSTVQRAIDILADAARKERS